MRDTAIEAIEVELETIPKLPNGGTFDDFSDSNSNSRSPYSSTAKFDLLTSGRYVYTVIACAGF